MPGPVGSDLTADSDFEQVDTGFKDYNDPDFSDVGTHDYIEKMHDEAMDDSHGRVQYNTGFDDPRQQPSHSSTDFTTPPYLDDEDWL